jgi:predicted DNA-binding transcriptional regulator YafY
LIRFKSEAADLVREREWHESQEMRNLPDGGLELTLRLGALAEIERWDLGWGASAEVLKPAALREKVKTTAAALTATYQT